MQTLKDVFRREDERLNLVNMGICIALVVLLVVVVFGIREMRFAVQQSPVEQAAPVPTEATTDEGK